MPFPSETSLESANREHCIAFFEELFSIQELKDKIRQFSPENVAVKRSSQKNRASFYDTLGIQHIQEKRKLAGILYELLGPHFLYEVNGVGPNDEPSRHIRYEILKKEIECGWITLDTVSTVVAKLPRRNGKGIQNLEEAIALRVPGPWRDELMSLTPSRFNLPSEVSEAPSSEKNRRPDIEIVTAIRELRPLHDYQIFAGKKIRDLLSSPKDTQKRLLVSIPTGAGKTRLVAESLIDWINSGKPSDDPNIQNSKYMLWIAQSRELCEQAISQFQEIYTHKGKSALTVFRFFGNRKITLDTILAQRVEHGLIVCTIDKIYGQIKHETLSQFSQSFQNAIEYDEKVHKSEIPQMFYDDRTFGRLRKMTSCIVIDESHKAIMPMYTCVLRGLGFNFRYKDEQKINEGGITLIGLTATAFRGTGLEPYREVRIGKSFHGTTKIHFSENDTERHIEVDSPIRCVECKEPLTEGEALQSTSNQKLIWHKHEQRLSEETARIYTRFSKPFVPQIHAFPENKKPKAIITCGEKYVAGDPIRISGEKSYDLLGSITNYSWQIKRRPYLTEVFGIVQPEETTIVRPESEPVIVEEIRDPGTYQISLTITNYDGLTDTATQIIEVIAPETTTTSNEMRELIQSLITREILCEVFHNSVKGGKIDLVDSKGKQIDVGAQIRKKAAESHSRNEKLVNMIHYLLTAPEEPRRKILVFACDIAHARFLALWLRTKYDISTDYIDSNMHESRNISRIQEFRRAAESEGKVLINTNMLTTGFDVPDIDCVVMGRPVISTVEYTQMIGRGMRGPRMGGTNEVWIVDFDDQIQLSERMHLQAIPLGWKSMAYDGEGNLVWKSLSEKNAQNGNPLQIDIDVDTSNQIPTPTKPTPGANQVNNDKTLSVKCQSCNKLSEGITAISGDYGLSSEDRDQLSILVESGADPELSALKICSQCKQANDILPDSNDPWKQLAVKEKSNPVLVEFVKHVAQNYDGNIKIDTTKTLNAEAICEQVIKKDASASEFDQLHNEIFALDDDDLLLVRQKIDEAKNAISSCNLGVFWRECMMLQKPPTHPQKLASLCEHLLKDAPLKSLDQSKKSAVKTGMTHDELLMERTEDMIFNILGFIPEEDKFKKTIDSSLYEYMLQKYGTYHNFQQRIPIADYILMLKKRSECLDKVIRYYHTHKKSPNALVLGKIIPGFKSTLRENFRNSKPSFFEMINQVVDSTSHAKQMTFDEIKDDYEYVKSLTPYAPSTEEILRHSKIGIGQYVQYSGSVANFQQIYELPDDAIRKQLEKLKSDYHDIKNVLGQAPDEDTIKKHTSYSQLMDHLWFDSYGGFLNFVGDSKDTPKHPAQGSAPTESKADLISNAKSLIRRGGMSYFFEKLVREPEFKYGLHFGGKEEFIKLLFQDNKRVAMIRWEEAKRNSA